jgi:phosphatidylinositol-3,4,5-trisphosphate 3-phosphatase/dual-specificity protein phosphatase PTEN
MLLEASTDLAKRRRTVADLQERVVHHLVPKTELVLDRAREMKIKFHLGSLPLGWAWFIPAFHLPEPIPPTNRTHTLRFPRSQIDFPLGPGQAVEEIVIKLEEIPMTDAASPAPLLSDQAEKEEGLDDQRGEGSPLDKVE